KVGGEGRVGRIGCRLCRQVDAGPRAERLDRPPGPAPAVGGRLAAVELEGREADRARHLLDTGARHVDEDPDQRRTGHRAGDLPGARQRHAARALRVEVEAEEVGAGGPPGARSLDGPAPPDLPFDGPASPPASAAPGSSRSMNASPTSTACAPAALMRARSAAERMPLSATSSVPGGTQGAS